MARVLTIAAVALLACAACAESHAETRVLGQSQLKAAPPEDHYKRPNVDKRLPGGRVVQGRRDIAAAWLSEPTNRYRGNPFGSDVNAAALVVSTAGQQVLRLRLAPDSVFEDLAPRLADLDGDGRDEIVLVRSYLMKGSVLAVLAVRGSAIEVVAETPPLGQPFQWLNPAAIADFDGDGRPDIALVAEPHRRGELQIWTLRGGRLVHLDSLEDVSNHAPRSAHQGLAAVADFNGDGTADLAIPSADRRTLRFLTMKAGRIRELAEAPLPAPAAEDFAVVQQGGRPAVRVGLAGGRAVTVQP